MWDPMITTFPGVYIFATVLARAAALLLPLELCCGTVALRTFNCEFSSRLAGSISRLHTFDSPPHQIASCSALWNRFLLLFPDHLATASAQRASGGSSPWVGTFPATFLLPLPLLYRWVPATNLHSQRASHAWTGHMNET
eukprot:SAG11_NODE_383_length_9899_cov_10.535510_4_plen_140_part_00